MQFFLIVYFDNDAGCLAQDIDALDKTVQSIGRFHFVAGMRKRFIEFFIGFRLIFETAHQSAADTGDLAGVE